MTAFVFFILMSAREGEGWFEGDYLINSLQKKIKKHRQPRSSIVKFLQILCSSCIRLILVYSLVVLGEGDGGSIRDDQILQFFPQT
jgi:hypothetical protein